MAVHENDLELLKLNLQEKESDIFTEEDLSSLLDTHQDVWLASYFGCCIKATANADMELPGGLKLTGNSDYWMKLAEVYYAKYLANNSSDNTPQGEGLNKAGYKNSMNRIDEFPRKRGW